jgi:uncharacterized DUF497 family protein
MDILLDPEHCRLAATGGRCKAARHRSALEPISARHPAPPWIGFLLHRRAFAFSTGIHYFMQSDEFEWDDAKAKANVRKHKLSFRAATGVFDDPLVLIEQDDSEDFGEVRYLAIGSIEGLLVAVAYTERSDRIRIISARKANGNEQRAYHHR